MKNRVKKIINILNNSKKRILYYFIGVALLTLGITLSILSGLGSGAFDALNFSLSKFLNISVGSAMYISIFTLYIFTMILEPKLKYLYGFLLTLSTGVFIDAWLGIISTPLNRVSSILYFISSVIILPIGIGCMIRSKLPLSPMDNFMLIVVKKTKKSISQMKTLIEISFACLALVFGYLAHIGTGTLSIGTIIITFSIGPLIQFVLRFIKEID